MGRKKVPTETIVEAYHRLKNVWKVGKEVGLCGQSVHERLQKAGVVSYKIYISDLTKQRIRDAYADPDAPIDLDALAKELKHSKTTICRFARSEGLTNQQRPATTEAIQQMSERMKIWMQENDHPRGMLGKTHTPEYCKECGKRAKLWWATTTPDQRSQLARKAVATRRENGNDGHHRGSWKAAWRELGAKRIFFRSRWEFNYAVHLEHLKKSGKILEWEHEPKTFWFEKIQRGVRSYLPDFRVTANEGTQEWHEVKGWMDDASRTKLKRFAKYYPKETLVLIDSGWFKKYEQELSEKYPEWEHNPRKKTKVIQEGPC